ncbi:MAG: division plane positioning ATPase MipZ, partial [Pseudomonadota bacterium]|nr:division plane positioning ATPase MipZ [Pseudomonadota bacterium]
MTAQPHRIVFANEKGGTGKSTTAVHVAVALAYRGARVAAFDLDHRQRTMCRYFENRAETMKRRRIDLPTVECHVVEGLDAEGMEALIARESQQADFILVDT